MVGSGNPPQCGANVGRATHVVLLLFLPHVEGDHGGDAVDAGEEGALLLPQLGKLVEEIEVLRQVLAVWPHPMLNLHTPPTQPSHTAAAHRPQWSEPPHLHPLQNPSVRTWLAA